ncbi:hypothetical protein RFF05_08570 [Bengtsoniella intestinalis]|uniref:hypothetical protein n=1 Tax=Bengtsoniella intestinalis TaxID=3073143 RepID=UPI00391F565D
MTGSKFKRYALVTTLVVALTTVAVFATIHYMQTKTVENAMSTKASGVYLEELFNPLDQWVAGETKQKEVWFGNHEETDQVIRFTIKEVWTDADGNEFTDPDDGATINWTDALKDDWTQLGDYYYYNSVLAPEDVTDKVMTGVSFSNTINNGGYGNTADYSDKTYSLTITMEALPVDADVVLANWSVTMTQAETVLTWSNVAS